MIPFLKPSMPSRRKLDQYLTGIYQRQWLTNNGPIAQELTTRLEEYLGVDNLLLVSSGTMALQVAYRALEIDGISHDHEREAITTPFTFVATESSLRWEGLRPKFGDIQPNTLNLCPKKAKALVSKNTQVIVPVHVYGNPCDVEAFAEISDRSGLKLVYDAAHSFGIRLNGKSVLNWGDAAVLSFHATKIFHTVEGGAIAFKDADAFERASEIINFGMSAGTSRVNRVGINAKMSEIHAAFGLALLDEIDAIIRRRTDLFAAYSEGLPTSLEQPVWSNAASRTTTYMPVLFKTNEDRSRCEAALSNAGISSRRYFYPILGSNDEIEQLNVAKSASERILCLPMYAGLSEKQVTKIISTIANVLE